MDQTLTDSEVTDEDLFLQLERALLDFPKLKKALPAEYPRARRLGITRAAMQQYSDHLRDHYWHHVNLPLTLHTYDGNPDENARQLMASLLKTLGDFYDAFAGLPGARGLLAPLWRMLGVRLPRSGQSQPAVTWLFATGQPKSRCWASNRRSAPA